MSASDAPPDAPPDAPSGEGALALRNALKLGGSLLATWSVALIVTFKLPKYLGPLRYGHYQFSDSFAATLFVFIGLGVDTYVQREVPVRPKHASDFFLGFFLTRLALAIPLFVVGALVVHAKVWDVQVAVFLFGLTQLFVTANDTFQKTLQASTRVDKLAIGNVLAKLVWGGGVFTLVTLKAPFVTLMLPMLVAEAGKAVFLFVATREAIDLELRIDWTATKAVLKESFPFFVANVAVMLGSRLDVTMLEFLNPGEEVGFYGSARQIANLSMLLAPILSGVVIPMMTRARARSEAEFEAILRRAVEGVTICSLPLTLLLALGSETWIRLALREEFLPAAVSLAYLAPTFVFAYGNVLLWLALMILGRSWTITWVSLGGLVALPALIALFVPMTRGLGPGGAGMGVAMALSLRELVVILVFLMFLGRRALDRRGALQIGKSLAICGAVAFAHHELAGLGPARLAVDAALYGALALVLRVVRPADGLMLLRMIRDRKKA